MLQKILQKETDPKVINFLGFCPLEKPPQNLGEKISLHRRYLGLSRSALAEAMGTDFHSIKRWENNNFTLKNFKSYLSKQKRRKLQKALGIQNLYFYPETRNGNLPKHLVTLDQHLKYKRFEESIPVEEIAKALGLSRVNYRYWENDKIQQINPERFVKIINYLGLLSYRKLQHTG